LSEGIHPAIVQLGVQYSTRTIVGSNARAAAMLLALLESIKDFQPSKDNGPFFKEFPLSNYVQFLVKCRPLSTSMGNAINHIKIKINETKEMAFDAAKEYVTEEIDTFLNERIVVADNLIAKFGDSKIENGDVILTYAHSHVVEQMFALAKKNGKNFKVVCVDSIRKREGQEFMKRLVHLGISCTYILITSVSYVMKEVTKVFVGAHSMMANGNLISRVGTANVALVAKAYHVPFMVCCETYKFTEKIQLESISSNELDDPKELLKSDHANDPDSELNEMVQQWTPKPNLHILNLTYDLTPREFIMMVITEFGLVPPTSVPVILREYRKDVK